VRGESIVRVGRFWAGYSKLPANAAIGRMGFGDAGRIPIGNFHNLQERSSNDGQLTGRLL